MKSMETIVIHMCVQRRTRHGCFSWFCTEILVRSSLLAKTLRVSLTERNACQHLLMSFLLLAMHKASIAVNLYLFMGPSCEVFYSHLGSYLLCNKQPPWLPLSGFCVITKFLSQTYPYFTFRVCCC